jgi:DNA-binding transcriptional LysR family regulator
MTELSVPTLRVVAEVVRLGSLTAAARSLGYSQSGISRQVMRAEREARCVLFVRSTRGTVPTDAARQLARRAESILATIELAARELEGTEAVPGGRVRMGAIPTAMAALVPRAVADLSGRHPDAAIELAEGKSASLLRRASGGRLDLAVVAGPVAPEAGLSSEVLVHDPLLVALPRSHPLAGRPSVGPDDLAGLTWVTGTTDPDASLLGSWWPEVRIGHVVRDWTAKVGMVAAGHGATIVPGLATAMLPPSLAVCRIDVPGAVRLTTLVRPDQDSDAGPHPAVSSLAEALRDIAAVLSNELRLKLRRRPSCRASDDSQ